MQNAKLDLPDRTKRFALRIVRVYVALPKNAVGQTLGKQLLRSGTSVGANYREAMRARSRPEFSSKMGIALQELEESRYWMELLIEAEVINSRRLDLLLKEAAELIAIFTASINTTRQNFP